MGSVPHLYTTGDNDPELEPTQVYRHYLYCDACGSFELDAWSVAESPTAIGKWRRRLALAATFSLPLVLVPAWGMLGMISAAFLTLLLAGIVFRLLWGGRTDAWSWLKWILVGLPFVAAAEWLAGLYFAPWVVMLAGSVLILVLLGARELLGGRLASRGLRCRQCDATYAHGSPFFKDLDANPRGFELDRVPRPLGTSPFEIGQHVGAAPAAEPISRLPR